VTDAAAPEEVRLWSVTELTLAIKDLLEPEFADLWVVGEVTNVSRPASGHLYFSLKDEGATLGAVVWRSDVRRLRFELEAGQEVLVHGRLDLYAPYGSYKIVVDRIEPRGAGALQVRFEQLKKKLAAEGLFDEARKRPLPFLPRRIGVVTAPRGAAVRDLVRTVLERFPKASILVRPAKVQGEGAAEDVAAGIADLGGCGLVDVVVVTRGGGSAEDLWTFNEEAVVRAVAACPVPVVSAVGHEIDFTLCDFAADVRAKTPTHAGVLVVPDLRDLLRDLEERAGRLRRALEARIRLLAGRLEALRDHWVLRRPRARLEMMAQSLDSILDRLPAIARTRIFSARAAAANAGRRLEASRPLAWLERGSERLAGLGRRLGGSLARLLPRAKERYSAAVDALEARSPVRILARGYSLTRIEGETAFLTEAADLRPGDRLETTFHAGKAFSRVESAHPAPPLRVDGRVS
jgi:exodeoxyribonuclease VII large subunit